MCKSFSLDHGRIIDGVVQLPDRRNPQAVVGSANEWSGRTIISCTRCSQAAMIRCPHQQVHPRRSPTLKIIHLPLTISPGTGSPVSTPNQRSATTPRQAHPPSRLPHPPYPRSKMPSTCRGGGNAGGAYSGIWIRRGRISSRHRRFPVSPRCVDTSQQNSVTRLDIRTLRRYANGWTWWRSLKKASSSCNRGIGMPVGKGRWHKPLTLQKSIDNYEVRRPRLWSRSSRSGGACGLRCGRRSVRSWDLKKGRWTGKCSTSWSNHRSTRLPGGVSTTVDLQDWSRVVEKGRGLDAWGECFQRASTALLSAVSV